MGRVGSAVQKLLRSGVPSALALLLAWVLSVRSEVAAAAAYFDSHDVRAVLKEVRRSAPCGVGRGLAALAPLQCLVHFEGSTSPAR